MLNIVIAGAPTGCWTNLGDQAIWAAMAARFRSIDSDSQLSVVSSNPQGFLEAHGATALPFGDLAGIEQAVVESDLVVLGGGSIFFDYWDVAAQAVLTDKHRGLSLWASVAMLAQLNRRPVMTYGVGVGPLSSRDGSRLAGATLDLADAVCVRDDESLAVARSLVALGDRPSLVTGDPAIGVSLPPPPLVEGQRPWLGVALRPWSFGVDEDVWQGEVAAALDRHLDRFGGTVVFVPCHRRVAWPLSDDPGVAETVRKRMANAANTTVIDVEMRWEERAALLADCDAVLAMRYHAALFALSAGRPVVSMNYDPKVEHVMTSWGRDDGSVALTDVTAAGLDERLAHAVDQVDEFAAQREVRLAALRQAERQNIDVAADLIEQGSRTTARKPVAADLLRESARSERPDQSQLAQRVLARLSPPDGSVPRVAILTNRLLDRTTGRPCIGGAERYARELGDLLRAVGLEPTFFQCEGDWGESDYFGFRVVALPGGESFSEFEPGVADAFFERTADFDHVVILAPNYASGRLRADAVVVTHGVWWDHDLYDAPRFAVRTPEWYEHLERVFARARRVVSVDANSINVVRALFPASAATMTLIPNFVDTDRFHPPAQRRAERSRPLVLIPRRIAIVRGARLVRAILDRLPAECDVIWAGEGTPAVVAPLEKIAADDERFRVWPAGFDEMPELYREADVCVIPTIGSEGQSLACLEAMASGCAVLATRVGGLVELIDDGTTGLISEPTAEAIGDATARLLRDPGLRRRLGAAAVHKAQRHSLVAWRTRWANLFDQLGWISDPGPAVDFDIVCFSIINWEARWQRPHQLMTGWGRRGRRVFWLRTNDHQPPHGETIAVNEIAENVWEVRIALGRRFGPMSGQHPEGFVSDGLVALQTLVERFDIRTAAAIVESAGWTPLVTAARDQFGWPVIYDCMDDWSTFPGVLDRAPLIELEELLVRAADRVVVSSGTIVDRWQDERNDLVLARNAADFDFFHDAVGDDPLPDIDGPIAGFIGAVAEWFDVELITAMANARPDVSFVFVGEIRRIDVAQLAALDNVRFEGLQPYKTMPCYVRRFDVCLIPFAVSPATDGMDVVKVYEYLSQGKPVVATPIKELRPQADLVYLADGHDEYLRCLDLALAEEDSYRRATRIEFAAANSWDARIAEFERAIVSRLATG